MVARILTVATVAVLIAGVAGKVALGCHSPGYKVGYNYSYTPAYRSHFRLNDLQFCAISGNHFYIERQIGFNQIQGFVNGCMAASKGR